MGEGGNLQNRDNVSDGGGRLKIDQKLSYDIRTAPKVGKIF